MEKKSTRLRQLLAQENGFIVGICVGTPHHAQLGQKVGFEVIMVSGSDTSTDVFGLPDAGFVTLTELVQNVERVCRAVELPVMVDCDTGFGNAINVRRTVDSVIRAGAAGLFIEDQVAPKRCGFVKGKQVIPIEEAVGKYRAALDVRNELDPDFIIMARTDARGAVGGSLAEAIRRGRAYLEAGVDILYVEALQSREEIRQVRQAMGDLLKGRWYYVTTKMIQPAVTYKEVRDLGICMPTCHISQIGSIAMYDFLLTLKEGGLDVYYDFIAKTKHHPVGGMGGVYELAGFPQVVAWEQKYLAPETLERYEQSLGMYDPRVGHQAEP
jgi:2-methylisocitrate lyase-like PEP mutase family enzyme